MCGLMFVTFRPYDRHWKYNRRDIRARPIGFVRVNTHPRNIVVIVADSLRFDSVYGRDGPGLPYMQAHAREFTQARSAGCWTLPSTASMFTGLLPHQHEATAQSRRLRPDATLLAERLRRHDIRTVQITANAGTTDIFGLDRGFDQTRRVWGEIPPHFGTFVRLLAACARPRFRRMLLAGDAVGQRFAEDLRAVSMWLQSSCGYIFDQALALLNRPDRDGRTFLFLNLMEAHFPYHVGPTFQWLGRNSAAKLAEFRALRFLINQAFLVKEGAALGPQTQDLLRRRQQAAWQLLRPQLDAFVREIHSRGDSLVVFTSDHGDNFGEQDWYYHFSNVTDAGIRVPLFWLDPNRTSSAQCAVPIDTHLLHDAILSSAGLVDAPSALLVAPESIPSMTESFWYNNRNKTLPRYRYNQFCFVEDGCRFVLRRNRWLSAPIAEGSDEPAFSPLAEDVDPVEDAVADPRRRAILHNAVRGFTHFANGLGVDGDRSPASSAQCDDDETELRSLQGL